MLRMMMVAGLGLLAASTFAPAVGAFKTAGQCDLGDAVCALCAKFHEGDPSDEPTLDWGVVWFLATVPSSGPVGEGTWELGVNAVC
jgi:hypothetical protein